MGFKDLGLRDGDFRGFGFGKDCGLYGLEVMAERIRLSVQGLVSKEYKVQRLSPQYYVP